MILWLPVLITFFEGIPSSRSLPNLANRSTGREIFVSYKRDMRDEAKCKSKHPGGGGEAYLNNTFFLGFFLSLLSYSPPPLQGGRKLQSSCSCKLQEWKRPACLPAIHLVIIDIYLYYFFCYAFLSLARKYIVHQQIAEFRDKAFQELRSEKVQ